MAKFDLKEAEKFVIGAIAENESSKELEEKFNDYFKKFDEKLEIKFEEAVSDWLIKVGEMEKRVDYPEAIPMAVQELLD